MFKEYEKGFDPSKDIYEEPIIPGISNFTNLYSSDDILSIINDSRFKDFAALYPEDARALFAASGLSGEGLIANEMAGANVLGNLDQSVEADTGVDNSINAAESAKLTRQSDLAKQGINPLGNVGPGGVDKGPITLKSILDSIKQKIKDVTGFEANDVFKTATIAALAKLAYDDAKEAREMQRGYIARAGDIPRMQAVNAGSGVGFRAAAEGGLMSAVGMVDPIGTMQRVMTDPRTQQKFEGYLMDELQQRGYTGGGMQGYANGGVARYFAGGTDGMADQIPAQIEGQRPAALSDGEFVVPADVVSHLGNGNSTAGAKRLYEMMDRIREARTGTTKQGRQIDANDFMPG